MAAHAKGEAARPSAKGLGRAEPSRAQVKPAAQAPLEASDAAGPLAHFFSELRELSAGTESGHVRVVWLGDSHTAADYLSGAVRSALAARFGDGGPGFVRVGTRQYRHDGLRVNREGDWNVDPDSPARRSVQDDGVFGFAGTRAVPAAGASFSVELNRSALPAAAQLSKEAATFELMYRLPEAASFHVELGGVRSKVTRATESEQTPHGIAHLTLNAPLGSRLLLFPGSGAAQLFGVIIERQSRFGVVLDSAGIDGARFETPLAWNETAFVSELARRAPDLFVLAYGTNEAFDALRVSKYRFQLTDLVRRVRLAVPRASCLVLGPTDAPRGEGSVPRIGEVTEVLRETSAELGCAFASLQQLMGGPGSFASGMKAKEPLAQADRLHLTPKGYQELGQALAKLLLDAYSAGRSSLP